MRNGEQKPRTPRVIASRVVTEVGGSLREIEISFCEPQQDFRGNWNCRLLIKGLGRPQIHRARGSDSLSALLFAVETAGVILDRTGSSFTWLENDPDKAGTGIPRYIPMFRGPRFEARVNLAIERESKRYYQTILDNRKRNIAAFEAEVKERREVLNALEGRLAKLKTRADDWQAELKEWKPKIARKTPS